MQSAQEFQQPAPSAAASVPLRTSQSCESTSVTLGPSQAAQSGEQSQ